VERCSACQLHLQNLMLTHGSAPPRPLRSPSSQMFTRCLKVTRLHLTRASASTRQHPHARAPRERYGAGRLQNAVLETAQIASGASPVTEAEFKMFKQAMGEQGLTKSSTKDVSTVPRAAARFLPSLPHTVSHVDIDRAHLVQG
jgi:hypothetical protein